MRLLAFKHSGEKPEIKPRQHMIEGGDDSRIDRFLEDLSICAFGKIIQGSGSKDVMVDSERKMKAIRRYSAALNGFLRGPQISMDLNKDRIRSMIQTFTDARLNAFSTKGDFPEMLQQNFDLLQGQEDYDLGYEQLFEPAIKDPNKEYFEVAILTRGVAFRRMAEGEKVRIEGMTGEKFQVYVSWFAAAMGVTEQAIRYRDLQGLADMYMAFRDALQSKRCGDFYGLINDAGSNTTSLTTEETSGQSLQDNARLINKMYSTLMRRFYGQPGYGSATGQRVVYLLHQPEVSDLVMGALRSRFQAFDTSELLVRYPVIPMVSLNSELWSGKGVNDVWMVIPGRKNKKHDELAPTTYQEADPFSLSYVNIVWTAYCGCVGDEGQVEGASLLT